jgi:hypothetical protein
VGSRGAPFEQDAVGRQYGSLPPKGDPGGAIKWRKVQIKPL